MERAEKEAIAGTIKEKFAKMTSAVFVDFKGLDVESVSKLRDEFRKSGVEYRVVKNSLVRHAIGLVGGAENPPNPRIVRQESVKGLDEALVGMTGIAWSFEDPSAAAKVVKIFRKDHDKLKIKAGLIEGQVLSGDAVETQLATMPGKNELRAMLLATMQAPLQQFLQQLNAPAQNLVYVIKAKEDKASAG